MDVPNEDGFSLPSLHLSKHNADGSQVHLTSTSSTVGYSTNQLWQEPFPRFVFIRGGLLSGESDLSENVDAGAVDVAAFMNFIFTPGRFAKVAIYNAFKVGSFLIFTIQVCSFLKLFFFLFSP